MYTVNDKEIVISGKSHYFRYAIRKVEEYEDLIIVLIGIPFSDNSTMNNIFCFDAKGELLWQSQDIKEAYPEFGKLMYACYEGMGILGDTLYATTFFGTCYHIDPKTGKLIGYHFVK